MLSIGENKEIEFKESKNKIPKSLWETYSAFCNSKGGIIVLGIKENRENDVCTVEGIENANHILKDFWNIINNREKISVNVLDDDDVKIVDIDGIELDLEYTKEKHTNGINLMMKNFCIC